jgi:PASTA domain
MFVDLLARLEDFILNIFSSDPGDLGGPEGRRARRHGRTEVPDVRGLRLDEARHALSHAGLTAEVFRLEPRPAPVMGTVVGQDPIPGTRCPAGRSVRLEVHHPPRARTDTL